MANAKNWPGHAEIFSATNLYGPLSSKRLGKIVQWTADKNLIYFFTIAIADQQSSRTR